MTINDSIRSMFYTKIKILTRKTLLKLSLFQHFISEAQKSRFRRNDKIST